MMEYQKIHVQWTSCGMMHSNNIELWPVEPQTAYHINLTRRDSIGIKVFALHEMDSSLISVTTHCPLRTARSVPLAWSQEKA